MIVRREILAGNRYLVVDEISRIIGTIDEEDFYDCMVSDETFEEDDETWFSVDKEKIYGKCLRD